MANVRHQHTPGPWHIVMKPGPIIYGPKGEQIVSFMDPVVTDVENTANALLVEQAYQIPKLKADNEALIAALEEQQDTLRRALKRIEYGTFIYDDIAECLTHNYNVIKQAKGEG